MNSGSDFDELFSSDLIIAVGRAVSSKDLSIQPPFPLLFGIQIHARSYLFSCSGSCAPIFPDVMVLWQINKDSMLTLFSQSYLHWPKNEKLYQVALQQLAFVRPNNSVDSTVRERQESDSFRNF